MKSCIIDCGSAIKKELLKDLEAVSEVYLYDGIPESVEEVEKRAAGKDIVIFALMQFSNEMLDRLPDLKILQFMGTGVSNFVDMEYAASKGISVQNIRGYGNNAVAEFSIGMAFALARHIPQGNNEVSGGRWDQTDLEGLEIADSTVGVVGTGNIGALVAEKYAKLGAKVIACDIFENEMLKKEYDVSYVSMEDIFSKSDIVSLHMIVTPENERKIDEKYFSSMKKGAFLVNAARAELVNTSDLYDALTRGKLAGAALDVFDHEPPSEDDIRLASLENVIATPHLGSYTRKAVDNSLIMSIEEILKKLKEF